MTGAGAEIVSLVALALTVSVAVIRPRGVSEAAVAAPAAVLLVLAGIVPAHEARTVLLRIGPTIGFLAAILVFGHLCAEAGVFDYLGTLAARASRGSASRLLALLVVVAAAVTAMLTLDATVVLLTPVVLSTVAAMRLPARAHLFVCARLANSGSLLLPVSNLTNLLAFGSSGLSFGRFAALMAVPWLLAVAMEWVSLRTAFRSDLHAEPAGEPAPLRAPRFALAVLALTVGAIVVASSIHVAVGWAALGGCVVLLAARLRTAPRAAGPVSVPRLVRAASPGFCLFVGCLAVIVDGVTRHGLGETLRHLLPHGTSLGALLVVVAVSAVLANLVNNLPATLALVPLVAIHPAWTLAMLIGVNIGPNATFGGSLATLLWRRLLPASERPKPLAFHVFGAVTVPVMLVVTTTALWGAIAVIGI